MRRLTACPHCEAEDDGRARFSISASNATDKDLLAAIPHLIQAMGAMSKEIAALKASRT